MARKNVYLNELQKIMSDGTAAAPTTASREEIASAINSITRELCGPLTNFERLNLVEDRQRLRKQLTAFDVLPSR